MKRIYSRFFKKIIFVSLAPKKASSNNIDYLKIVENVVPQADEMNLMCVSISIGGKGKQKNPL